MTSSEDYPTAAPYAEFGADGEAHRSNQNQPSPNPWVLFAPGLFVVLVVVLSLLHDSGVQ